MDERLETQLRALLPTLRAVHGVRRLAVFGSRARGTASATSDLDVLVEFDGGATLDRFLGTRALLESELGIAVDLTTPGALHPLLRDPILAEARDVA